MVTLGFSRSVLFSTPSFIVEHSEKLWWCFVMKRNAVVDNELTKEMVRGKDGGKKDRE